jgi:hypothetical protein
MGKLLLLIPIILFYVCIALLVDFWIKLYTLSTVPVTALTMARCSQILSLALGIGTLTMFTLIFLFVILELA